jgi:hypothetical protein
VAALATGRNRKIGATRHGIRTRGRCGADRAEQQEQGGANGPYFLISARNFW